MIAIERRPAALEAAVLFLPHRKKLPTNRIICCSVAKLSSASAMAHDSDTEGQGDRNEKGKQTCLSASGNKKCVCHKKTTNVDVCEIED